MPGRLDQKRCLIVGGTSGLGLATAMRFLEEGARLVISGKSPEVVDWALGTLCAAVGFACDAADSAQVTKLFEQTISALGGLDVVYHVAGMSGRSAGDGPLHECTDEGWQS